MYTIAALAAVLIAVAVWAFIHYEPSFSLNRLLDLFGRYGYFVIFVPVMLETAGLPLPGEITLILSGVAAHNGTLELGPLIVVGSLARPSSATTSVT